MFCLKLVSLNRNRTPRILHPPEQFARSPEFCLAWCQCVNCHVFCFFRGKPNDSCPHGTNAFLSGNSFHSILHYPGRDVKTLSKWANQDCLVWIGVQIDALNVAGYFHIVFVGKSQGLNARQTTNVGTTYPGRNFSAESHIRRVNCHIAVHDVWDRSNACRYKRTFFAILPALHAFVQLEFGQCGPPVHPYLEEGLAPMSCWMLSNSLPCLPENHPRCFRLSTRPLRKGRSAAPNRKADIPGTDSDNWFATSETPMAKMALWINHITGKSANERENPFLRKVRLKLDWSPFCVQSVDTLLQTESEELLRDVPLAKIPHSSNVTDSDTGWNGTRSTAPSRGWPPSCSRRSISWYAVQQASCTLLPETRRGSGTPDGSFLKFSKCVRWFLKWTGEKASFEGGGCTDELCIRCYGDHWSVVICIRENVQNWRTKFRRSWEKTRRARYSVSNIHNRIHKIHSAFIMCSFPNIDYFVLSQTRCGSRILVFPLRIGQIGVPPSGLYPLQFKSK